MHKALLSNPAQIVYMGLLCPVATYSYVANLHPFRGGSREESTSVVRAPFFWIQDMNPEPSMSQLSSHRHLPVQAPTELHTITACYTYL